MARELYCLCVAVDFLAVVNDGSCDLAASLESICNVAVVGRFFGKPLDRLFALRAEDPDLVCDFCESSGSLRDYCSVDAHF